MDIQPGRRKPESRDPPQMKELEEYYNLLRTASSNIGVYACFWRLKVGQFCLFPGNVARDGQFPLKRAKLINFEAPITCVDTNIRTSCPQQVIVLFEFFHLRGVT